VGSERQECDFCGVEEMSNGILHSDRTVEYCDGPPSASVPTTILCYDCAQDVSDYLETRANKTNQSPDGLAPFEEADAQALLDRLAENNELVIELGRSSGYGIRVIDGEWKRAICPNPAPPMVEELTRKEVLDRILSAKRLTLKQLDPSAWERFETDGSVWDASAFANWEL